MTPARKAALIGHLSSLIMRVWLRTLRFDLTDHAGVMQPRGQSQSAPQDAQPLNPLLWSFWHNRLFVMAYMFERFFPGRPGAALASASKDGEIIAAIMERFGIRAIRGSSSRRGAVALVEMKRAIGAGDIMAITPDGPRGPRYHVNPGVIKLAQITQGAVLPIHVTYSSFWRLRSWDGFLLPKPFSRISITFAPVHPVAATDSPEAFEAERQSFERVLRPANWQQEIADAEIARAKRKGPVPVASA